MREPLDWRNARALARSGGLGTLGGRLDQAQPIAQRRPQGSPAQPGRGHGVIIAASNATDKEKKGADIVCDGTDDDVQIQAGLSALAASDWGGGSVHLTSGSFQITTTVDVPFGSALFGTGSAQFGTTFLDVVDVDGFHVDGIAYFADLSIWNHDPTHGGTAGIFTDYTSSVINSSGYIYRCGLGLFETQVKLGSMQFYVRDNVLWAHSGPEGGWCMKLVPSAGSTSDYHIIENNQLVFGSGGGAALTHGIYAETILSKIRSNDMRGSADAVSLQLAGGSNGENKIDGNDFEDGQVLVGKQSNRLRDNNAYGTIEVSSNDNVIRGTTGTPDITIDAGATDNWVWDNDINTFTDAGTGTKLNLDGSANDWNH